MKEKRSNVINILRHIFLILISILLITNFASAQGIQCPVEPQDGTYTKTSRVRLPEILGPKFYFSSNENGVDAFGEPHYDVVSVSTGQPGDPTIDWANTNALYPFRAEIDENTGVIAAHIPYGTPAGVFTTYFVSI